MLEESGWYGMETCTEKSWAFKLFYQMDGYVELAAVLATRHQQLVRLDCR